MRKRGDTLIEVALAIGIFSLVAITVVSVVSASTGSAQSSLELTITREELDAQAEALRFIHESYVSGSQSKDTTENAYAEVWKAITDRAVPESSATNIAFNPATCSSLYNPNGFLREGDVGKNPFIINIRQLNNPGDPTAIVRYNSPIDTKSIFYPPTTYPRIIYGSRTVAAGSDVTEEDLLHQATSSADTIQRVEGIFIIAVKDNGSPIVSGSGGISTKPAYYDFYIRSCWMPVGSDRASAVSTTIRLYDPAVIAY